MDLSQTEVAPLPEEENESGSGFGFFETEQPLPTNISSVKITKTFTDE